MFSSGVLAALGGVWLITGNRNKLVAYSKEQADQFGQTPCTPVHRAEVAFKDLEPFSKLEAARHDRRPSFALCGIAASMGHAREESIVHHIDKHKALEQLVEAHDDVERSDAASLLFFGQCAAQRRHLRVKAAIDLQEQRCRSWNQAFGYARAFELPPPGTPPLRRSAFATASPRQCELHPQVQARPQTLYPTGTLIMVRQSSNADIVIGARRGEPHRHRLGIALHMILAPPRAARARPALTGSQGDIASAHRQWNSSERNHCREQQPGFALHSRHERS